MTSKAVLKAEVIGPSRLSKCLESLNKNSPGKLPMLLSLKVVLPDQKNQIKYRSLLRTALPGLYYNNPNCKISFDSLKPGELPHISYKFAGSKEGDIPLKSASTTAVLDILKECSIDSSQSLQVGATSGSSTVPTRAGRGNPNYSAKPRSVKNSARSKAQHAWRLSRFLDNI